MVLPLDAEEEEFLRFEAVTVTGEPRLLFAIVVISIGVWVAVTTVGWWGPTTPVLLLLAQDMAIIGVWFLLMTAVPVVPVADWMVKTGVMVGEAVRVRGCLAASTEEADIAV